MIFIHSLYNVYNYKHLKYLYLLVLISIFLTVCNGFIGFFYAKNNVSKVSENYNQLTKTLYENPKSLNNQTLFFYKSSCKHCQKVIPVSYTAKYLLGSYGNNIHYFNVDNQDVSTIKNDFYILRVPNGIMLHWKADNKLPNNYQQLQLNRVDPLNFTYLIWGFLIACYVNIMFAIIIFFLGVIISSYMYNRHNNWTFLNEMM